MTDIVYEPSKTTHWKNLFPQKKLLLGSHNLNEGEELVATIEGVAVQTIKAQNGNDEEVPVVTFTNAPPMVLNITNTRAIASLYGERYDGWPGKSIQVYACQVKAFGIEQMALRIREAIPDTLEDIEAHIELLRGCKDMEQLQNVFMGMPKHLKPRLATTKDEMKEKLNVSE